MTPDTIEIAVEQRHIDAGLRHNGERCPVVLAAREQGYPKAFMSIAKGLTPVDSKRSKERRWFWSAPAHKFANDFDLGKSVRPARFVFRAESVS